MGERSLTLFFNGTFRKEQHNVVYEGVNQIIMTIPASEFSCQYIIDLLSSVECCNIEVVRYRIPRRTVIDGLRLISNDFDVRSLVGHFNIYDNIEIYIQYPSGSASFRESSKQGGNVVRDKIDSEEEDGDYVRGLSSEEELDEELMEAKRAIKLAKQRSTISSKQVDHESK